MVNQILKASSWPRIKPGAVLCLPKIKPERSYDAVRPLAARSRSRQRAGFPKKEAHPSPKIDAF